MHNQANHYASYDARRFHPHELGGNILKHFIAEMRKSAPLLSNPLVKAIR
jgi:hypothetical protein